MEKAMKASLAWAGILLLSIAAYFPISQASATAGRSSVVGFSSCADGNTTGRIWLINEEGHLWERDPSGWLQHPDWPGSGSVIGFSCNPSDDPRDHKSFVWMITDTGELWLYRKDMESWLQVDGLPEGVNTEQTDWSQLKSNFGK